MREKLIEIISDAEVQLRFKLAIGHSLSPVENATILADHLIARGVTILPEGAIILTRKEIDALNEYQAKRDKELAEKIFGEIEKWLAKDGDIRLITADKFAKLKKKYTESENHDGD